MKKSKEQDQSDKLESAKELESIAEQPDEKIYNPSRRWSVSSEILLLKCLADNKPSGIHKHFHMANICYLFNKNNASPRSSKEIWDHVDSMYDLQAIDEMEFSGPDEWSTFQDRILNFSQFQEFDLPEPDFKILMDKKNQGCLNIY
ncbi:hypothetical protein DSO57_1004743 [Entomophthora muscae]|uniref:Uncharacterized protein n=1 Tax=Entomophthora muscae TaxID=34485 RepID=A0ACC2TIU2_9FUNG|nr:hypothetical protein DSO57_1004743 [Entomophthora muscae]